MFYIFYIKVFIKSKVFGHLAFFSTLTTLRQQYIYVTILRTLIITKKEESTIRELLNNNSIVIRPVDKGSGIVVLDADEYKSQMERELENNATYREASEDQTQKINNGIKRLIDSMYKNNEINKDMKNYLKPINSRGEGTRKPQNPQKENNPFRTMVNGRNHPTENIAEFVKNELRDNVKSLPSYIQDTTEKVSTDSVLKLMDYALENNSFSFDGKHYAQTEGTSIGSKLGMCYASTYLGAWETKLFHKAQKTQFTYYRYIDDIWGIWTHGKEELIKFHKTANSIHQNIQIDLRFSSNKKIEFLDVYASIQNGSVKTEVYSKPSTKHLYLHVKSDHPFSMKKSIPYGLGIRAKRICSDEADYRKENENIKKRLVKRGYKKEDIDEQLGKVDQQKREDLLEYRQNTQKINKRVPLVVTHSRALPDIRRILRKHQNILMRSDHLKKASEYQPLLALRRDKNLQDILVHKKDNKMLINQKQGCHKCDRKKCILCPRLLTGDEFWEENGNTYKVKGRVTCLSENVVYAV